MKIGILALQGNYFQHKDILFRLSIETIFVKYPEQLEGLSGLIIPGGESSVISKHLEQNNFRNAVIEFSKNKSIFGTCAGMILMSSTERSPHVCPLNLMDFTIKRNAWGRQIDSFSANIQFTEIFNNSFYGYFIRAPKINTKSNNIRVLATYDDEPVLLTDGKHLVSSFHPEIGNDVRMHQYFIENLYA